MERQPFRSVDERVALLAAVLVVAVQLLCRSKVLHGAVDRVGLLGNVKREVEVRLVFVRAVAAFLALDLRAEVPAEERVHGRRLLHAARLLRRHHAQAGLLHRVKQATQELVRVLLPPAPELPAHRAHVEHHALGADGVAAAATAQCGGHLRELAERAEPDGAAVPAVVARLQIVGEDRTAQQALQRRVQEAGVAEVLEAQRPGARARLPLRLELRLREQNLGWVHLLQLPDIGGLRRRLLLRGGLGGGVDVDPALAEVLLPQVLVASVAPARRLVLDRPVEQLLHPLDAHRVRRRHRCL